MKRNKEGWKIYFNEENKVFPWLVSNDGGNTGHQFHYEKSAIDFCKKMNEEVTVGRKE